MRRMSGLMCACRVIAACAVFCAFVGMAAQESAGQSAPAGLADAKSYETVFSTYLGGSSGEILRDITVDAQGDIYVAGSTASIDFPRTAGAVAGESKNKGGAVVAKFGPTGTLTWSKVITGDYFYSVKVDGTGHVFVAGRVQPGFPTTPGASQAKNAGE